MTEPTNSVEKAIDVLFDLHEAGEPLGVTQVGKRLGLPKSSAHRLLSALSARGLVERDGQGRYRPGLALAVLGRGVLDGEPIVRAARPVLRDLARRTGETAFLTAARSGRIVVLDKAEGQGFLRVSPTVGSEVPVHATAVGKLQLAFGPDAIPGVAGEPEAFTERTRTTGDALAREVALARRRGWAENREEWIAGLAVVAAPVFLESHLEGSIVLAAPSSRLSAVDARKLAPALLEAAREIGRTLVPGRSAA